MVSLPQSAEAEWYRITNQQMECICSWCGFPLFVGDRALEAYGDVFCSVSCARESHAKKTEEAKD